MLTKIIVFDQDPIELAHFFRNESYFFFLDSSQQEQSRDRFSFMGFDPFDIFESKSQAALPLLKQRVQKFFDLWQQDAQDLGGLFNRSSDRMPCPGLVGFIAYDHGLSLESIPPQAMDDLKLPDVLFGFYDFVLVFDHLKKTLTIISTGFPHADRQARERKARQRLTLILDKIQQGFKQASSFSCPGMSYDGPEGEPRFQSNFSREQYCRMIETAQQHIAAGDIYQVNLSQRYEFDPDDGGIDPFDVYRHLRSLSPCPFGCYFQAGAFQILCNSPERFLKLQDGVVQTCPMKGTRPRGGNEEEDALMRQQIIESKKEKAELLMITDLERNDLGRVCQYGSVRVVSLRVLEEYPTVYQTTSTIEGRIQGNKDCFDVLQACFPGGSITGCPKIRAMEIIEELEPHRRGIYTGTMGYIDYSGNMDFNILIRTLLSYQNKYYYQVGGGIVTDSIAEHEYQETLVKAKAIQQALTDIFGARHLHEK
ncbi:MAG: aminodeoxychorismate synthase component I [Candidatus Omnitrophica bacterium]|nr:aminodeoxychorismate synthase component I [Candidatus Omnitrophota bacterium]